MLVYSQGWTCLLRHKHFCTECTIDEIVANIYHSHDDIKIERNSEVSTHALGQYLMMQSVCTIHWTNGGSVAGVVTGTKDACICRRHSSWSARRRRRSARAQSQGGRVRALILTHRHVQAFTSLSAAYPDQADALYTSLDQKTQRQLQGSDSAASSTTSINSVGLVNRSQENLHITSRAAAYSAQQRCKNVRLCLCTHACAVYANTRSTSDIDAGAARRAAQSSAVARHNVAWGATGKPPPVPQRLVAQPLQPNNSLRKCIARVYVCGE